MCRLVRCFLCESGRQNDEARPFMCAGLHNDKDDASLQPTALPALACRPVWKMSLMLSMLLSVRRADASCAAAKPRMTPIEGIARPFDGAAGRPANVEGREELRRGEAAGTGGARHEALRNGDADSADPRVRGDRASDVPFVDHVVNANVRINAANDCIVAAPPRPRQGKLRRNACG